MRAPAVLVLVLVLARAVAGSDAAAQSPGGMPTLSPAELAEANDACDRLAGIPNAPMSVQACKAMLGMAGTAERQRASAADPSARRPGDEQLSCDAIFAEMSTLGGEVLPDAGASQADAAVADGTALGTYRKSHIPDGPGYTDEAVLAKLRPMIEAGRVVACTEAVPGIGVLAPDPDSLVARLAELAAPDVAVDPQQPGLRCLHLRDGDADMYLFVNEAPETLRCAVTVRDARNCLLYTSPSPRDS